MKFPMSKKDFNNCLEPRKLLFAEQICTVKHPAMMNIMKKLSCGPNLIW